VVALVPLTLPLAALLLRLGAPAYLLVAAAVAAIAGASALRWTRDEAERRRRERELPAVCEALAAAARAGLPIVDAFAAIAPSRSASVADALRESAALFRLGRGFEEATRPIDVAFGPPALLLRETLRAFHRRGGEIPRALDRAAVLARQEVALREETAALTAQGRASALVLALLAPCGLVFSSLINPSGALAFIADARGGVLMTVALVLEGIGAFWLWRLVRA
jgi:tight adherence protein B